MWFHGCCNRCARLHIGEEPCDCHPTFEVYCFRTDWKSQVQSSTVGACYLGTGDDDDQHNAAVQHIADRPVTNTTGNQREKEGIYVYVFSVNISTICYVINQCVHGNALIYYCYINIHFVLIFFTSFFSCACYIFVSMFPYWTNVLCNMSKNKLCIYYKTNCDIMASVWISKQIKPITIIKWMWDRTK